MPFNRQYFRFSSSEFYSKNIIFVYFPYNPLLKNELRVKFPTARLSATDTSKLFP